MQNKRIHFIGICGVAMSGLALAFKKQGWKVTGSDVGFYPPVSTNLKNAGVDYYAGWHVDKMIAAGAPDLVVVGNVASSSNPEWLYTQAHKLNYKSYPEVIKEFFVKQNSIVCAGTYGKTTSTALLTWILKEAGFDPSYMFGGVMISPPYQGGDGLKAGGGLPSRADAVEPTFENTASANHPRSSRDSRPLLGKERITMPSAAMTNSNWSVLEGDEYKSSRWDNGPKFAHYSPTHLLLTSVVWDHADVYPTEEAYVKVFKKLIAAVPKGGIKVISEKVAIPRLGGVGVGDPLRGQLAQRPHPPLAAAFPAQAGIVTYGREPSNNYVYTDIIQTKNGIQFAITEKISNIQYPISSQCLGEYMADNITGCFALARQIGIPPKKIINAIASFKSLKRRLEKRYEGDITIFDDIAHSPTKAQAILETLRKVYARPLPTLPLKREAAIGSAPLFKEGTEGRSHHNLIAIFEPNTGNRQPEAIPQYDNAFKDADEVIIPRLTKIKMAITVGAIHELPLHGADLATIISKTHPNAHYIDDDQQLVNYLQRKTHAGDVVVFMGSHGFRGMIEALVNAITKSK